MVSEITANSPKKQISMLYTDTQEIKASPKKLYLILKTKSLMATSVSISAEISVRAQRTLFIFVK